MPKHDIIFVSADPWEHYTWRRRHHVAWNLSKENRVLYVEPPLTLFQPFREIDLHWKHVLNLGRMRNPARNLYTYSPVRLLPLSLPGAERFKYFEMDKHRTFRRLKKIIQSLNFKNPILWVYFSEYQYDYYGLFGEKIRVTDWYDKLATDSGIDLTTSQVNIIKNKEAYIINNSDIVFAVSEELAGELRVTGKRIDVIPQGVDYESFQNTRDNKNKIQKYVNNIKRPRLGFIGIMHYIVDFELLNYIAGQRPDWSIMLLGRKWLRNVTDIGIFNELIKKENVYYFGEKPREALPLYLSKVDVCLAPMKKIELNRSAAPLKLWEYLAAGKPIVAVDQGVKYDCDEFIKMANDKKEFIAKIEECLKNGNNYVLVEKRKQIAKDNSWENRIKTMLEIIDHSLSLRLI